MTVDRYITVHDAGRILHPGMADGQIRVAFAQGLGAALMEEFRYGADGSFQSGTFADYLVPTACEVPDPVIVHLHPPSPFTPLGAKGIGEDNNMSTPVCVANAFADALRPLKDVADIRLPLTPSRVPALIGADEPAPPAAMAAAMAEAAASAPRSAPTSAPASAPASSSAGAAGSTMQARGHVDIAATPACVFAILLDPAALAQVIPGCHPLLSTGANQYQADVTVLDVLGQLAHVVEHALAKQQDAGSRGITSSATPSTVICPASTVAGISAPQALKVQVLSL